MARRNYHSTTLDLFSHAQRVVEVTLADAEKMTSNFKTPQNSRHYNPAAPRVRERQERERQERERCTHTHKRETQERERDTRENHERERQERERERE